MEVLTRFGIMRSRVTLLVIFGLLAQGVLQYIDLPKREDPAVTIRTVVVSATAEGMAPERVENLIVTPIERKAREIGEIDDITSLITTGSAIVNLEVGNQVPEADLESVFQEIRNKMASLEGSLPQGANGPFVNTDYGNVVINTIAVTGEGYSHAEREYAAKQLQSHLYTIDGVAKVSLLGVQEERILLEFDSRKLASVGVQIPTLLDDLRAQNVVLPAGQIDAGGTNLILEANGDLGTIEDIENVLTKVEGLGGYVRLSDLLTVRRTYQSPMSKPAFFNGQPAVMVAIEMSDGQDIQKLGKHLRSSIIAHEQTQPIGISYGFSTAQDAKVTQAVNSALSNVGQTFLVVLVVMFIFLGTRPALIIASIVPLSVTFALLGMAQIGVDLEQISIAAVIISLGLLVDNGLVVVEDVQSRIDAGIDPQQAAVGAGGQFFLPLAVASITTVSAFLPMIILDGTEGEFAFSLGAVVALMLAGSWITAMYILPALCAWFIVPSKQVTKSNNKWFITFYKHLLKRILPWSLVIIGCSYALVIVSVTFLFPLLKSEMFPLSERNQFLIYMDMPKGTAISETTKSALTIERWIADQEINPEILNTSVYMGDGGPRFYLSLSPADSNPSSAFFLINTRTDEGAVIAANRAQKYLLEQHPEARFKVKRLSMGGSESGIVNVELSGPDADVLLRKADEIESLFANAPNIVQNENDWGNKVLKIIVNVAQDKARELGVTSQSISEALDGYFTGSQVSEYREGDKSIPITVRAKESYRDSVEDLANLTFASGGRLISLDQVADIQPYLEYSQIRRENQRRKIIVFGKSSSLTASELLAYVQPGLDALELPNGYSLEIGGETQESADVNGKLIAGIPMALSVMLLALMVQFNSVRRVSITFMTIPLVIIGAPVVLILLGRPLSFFAILGMISLAGIIINNAIVMIDQIDIERKSLNLKEAIVAAAGKRFTPIMLTSLTTVFGLVPMAIAGGALFEPMATLMIGGLIVASLITLLFVPATYYLFFHREQKVKA